MDFTELTVVAVSVPTADSLLEELDTGRRHGMAGGGVGRSTV